MRRAATAVLLVAVLTALSPACVAGVAGSCEQQSLPDQCSRQPQGSPAARMVKAADRSVALSASTPRCGLRTFLQFAAAQPVAVSLSAPQPLSAKAFRHADAVIIVSSVGPSETDRGPPVS